MHARTRFPASFWHWRTIRKLRKRVRKYRNFARFYKNKVITGGGSKDGFNLINGMGARHDRTPDQHIFEASSIDMAQVGMQTPTNLGKRFKMESGSA